MTISKKDNWKGASPALIDAITHINNLLKERGVNAECDNIYIQYRRFDGFALNIVGDKLDDDTITQCQLYFKFNDSDYNEYPHEFIYERGTNDVTTQLFIVENDVFYVLDSDDTCETYKKDRITAMLQEQEPLEYESVFTPIYLPNKN